MLRVYMGGSAALFVMGQQGAATVGDSLLDRALSGSEGFGPIIDEASKVATLGISQVDAAVIVAVAGVAWKFLDAQQKGGTFETFNLWLRRKLKVDHPNPPPPPLK